MAEPVGRRTDELRARHRRIRAAGLLASLGLHLLLFLILLLLGGPRAPRSPYAAAGPRSGDDRAAPTGGGMQALNLVITSPRPEVPRVPAPIPVPEVVVEPEPDPVPAIPAPDEIPALTPGVAGRDAGAEPGSGIEGGDGRGDGGTDLEGRFRVVPPTPRGLILPPSDRPSRVRGREVTVWVFVDEQGRVVADSTRLLPTTGDSKFDDRLKRHAAEWVFEPARRSGQAIAEWFRYTISL